MLVATFEGSDSNILRTLCHYTILSAEAGVSPCPGFMDSPHSVPSLGCAATHPHDCSSTTDMCQVCTLTQHIALNIKRVYGFSNHNTSVFTCSECLCQFSWPSFHRTLRHKVLYFLLQLSITYIHTHCMQYNTHQCTNTTPCSWPALMNSEVFSKCVSRSSLGVSVTGSRKKTTIKCVQSLTHWANLQQHGCALYHANTLTVCKTCKQENQEEKQQPHHLVTIKLSL